jgi:ribosome-binding factor A
MGLRQDRLADEIRDILAPMFARGDIADRRLEQITITFVKLTGDLQLASIYFRVIPDDDATIAAAHDGFKSATGFMRRHLADQLDLRRVPNLRFFYDESIERGARIEDLITKLD